MKRFFSSDEGKAMVGLGLTCILIVWPPSVSWLAAAYALSFTVAKLQNAFQRLEAAESTTLLRSNDAPELVVADLLVAGGDSRRPAAR